MHPRAHTVAALLIPPTPLPRWRLHHETVLLRKGASLLLALPRCRRGRKGRRLSQTKTPNVKLQRLRVRNIYWTGGRAHGLEGLGQVGRRGGREPGPQISSRRRATLQRRLGQKIKVQQNKQVRPRLHFISWTKRNTGVNAWRK